MNSPLKSNAYFMFKGSIHIKTKGKVPKEIVEAVEREQTVRTDCKIDCELFCFDANRSRKFKIRVSNNVKKIMTCQNFFPKHVQFYKSLIFHRFQKYFFKCENVSYYGYPNALIEIVRMKKAAKKSFSVIFPHFKFYKV